MLQTLDLFSGIGGFSLGLERTGGYRTVAFCEKDEFCQQVLKKHWPNIPLFKDIRQLQGADIEGHIDVICGGYPCQPFSDAGKREGAEDDRHLWPEMYRLIQEIRPTWVIGENVIGHVQMGLNEVLSDLEKEGYQYSVFIIPACAVDAPHRRDRVWIIANVAHTEITGLERRENSRRARPKQPRFRKSSGAEPHQWLPEPAIRRVDNGIPRRVDRLKALGNAVVPQVVEKIGYSILEVEGFGPGHAPPGDTQGLDGRPKR